MTRFFTPEGDDKSRDLDEIFRDPYADENSMDPVIERLLAALPPEHIGDVTGVNRIEYNITVGWVWMPDCPLPYEWEGQPFFHVQFGKYALGED